MGNFTLRGNTYWSEICLDSIGSKYVEWPFLFDIILLDITKYGVGDIFLTLSTSVLLKFSTFTTT